MANPNPNLTLRYEMPPSPKELQSLLHFTRCCQPREGEKMRRGYLLCQHCCFTVVTRAGLEMRGRQRQKQIKKIADRYSGEYFWSNGLTRLFVSTALWVESNQTSRNNHILVKSLSVWLRIESLWIGFIFNHNVQHDIIPSFRHSLNSRFETDQYKAVAYVNDFHPSALGKTKNWGKNELANN